MLEQSLNRRVHTNHSRVYGNIGLVYTVCIIGLICYAIGANIYATSYFFSQDVNTHRWCLD